MHKVLWEKKVHLDNTIFMSPMRSKIGEGYGKSMKKAQLWVWGFFGLFLCFPPSGSSWLLEFPQEENESEEDIGRAPSPCSSCFWAHIMRSYLWVFWQMKMRVAGKVILICQIFKYWPKESSIQFLVQLASMAPNGTHNQFLPSATLGSEAYVLFFI